jgi:hypothetical protein
MDYQRLFDLTEKVLIVRGGRGSGNWGHVGRKGKKGGSGKGGGFKRIGVKPGASLKEIKQASRQTRAKDKRSKQKIGASVSLLRKEKAKLSSIGFDAQNILGSLVSGKGEVTGKANERELAAINKLTKAGYATHSGDTLKLTKAGRETGKAVFETEQQVKRIDEFAKKLSGPKRSSDDFFEISIDGYDQLLNHEKHLLALTLPLPSSKKRAKDTEKGFLPSGELKKVLGRIDTSLKKSFLSNTGAKADDILDVNK